MINQLMYAGGLALMLTATVVQADEQTKGHGDQDTIERGAYLSRAGDCVACHTAPGGDDFAGGLGIESPFGTIYSTNITPDKQAGIGNYSEAEFAAALRQGKRADGANLYPAMPYPSYARLTDDDIHALYVYFMHGVAPNDHQPQTTDLSFPFNQRWGISGWNWLFADQKPFEPDDQDSEKINRGRYLVEGLGHCGSCHTPRGLFQQEKALNDDDGDEYLAGANLNDWLAPGLRGKGEDHLGVAGWREQDIADYLATGRNAHSAVSGEMTSVIKNSTSHMTRDDLSAIAAYLKTLPVSDETAIGSERHVSARKDSETEQQLTRADDLSEGGRLYLDNCNACHFADGRGASGVFPALAGNSQANADNPTALIHTILAGAQLPSTPERPEALMMPGFGWRLSDQEVADLATFVRQGWGNQGGTVSSEAVRKVRDSMDKREGFSGNPDTAASDTSAAQADAETASQPNVKDNEQ
ncbi:Cytochrome c, mono-and diheme variants [Kushneria avicenniae]|uniref:Cytochrome c, mono-and diheme variants n=1 Tax=Kushneria avicenniae TaxID=402385 RepID=A0A1I1JIU4_9GAMM|nr:cytochrome c [Kushneria avicenniae]SFC45380.1 Cytochrome c, mono-and diheme variants [Kushneria avicenniae]